MMPLLLPPRRRLHAHAPEPRDDAPRSGSAPAAGTSPRNASQSRRGARFDEMRLLIVDDDFLFADMLPKLLRKSIAKPALVITSAKTPQEALQRLSGQSFDVVLCDYDLRDEQTGLDVLAHASRLANPPFRILLSGHSPREIPQAPGTFDAFMDKPMVLREIVPLLTGLLHERLGVEFDTRPAGSP